MSGQIHRDLSTLIDTVGLFTTGEGLESQDQPEKGRRERDTPEHPS